MKTRNLYIVVDNHTDELPSAIGTAEDIMKFLSVKRSRFYKLLQIESSDTLPFLVFKLDEIGMSEDENMRQH